MIIMMIVIIKMIMIIMMIIVITMYMGNAIFIILSIIYLPIVMVGWRTFLYDD